MDKGDIWLPQKIAPMLGKVPGAEAAAFNRRRPINTWPKSPRKVEISRFGLPGKGDFLICHIMRELSVICWPIIEKENNW